MTYRVAANFTVKDCDSEREALRIVGTAVELWSEDDGIEHISGIGFVKGSVSIEKVRESAR